MVVMLYCAVYLPGVKASGYGAVNQGLLNILEKAYTDHSLLVALLQLTQPGCSCSEAQSCMVRSSIEEFCIIDIRFSARLVRKLSN